ncbi:hypothetical protein CDD81_4326 [Ophiocordyceps australis]|uniref:Uncharacterized protein n=1 Tax=Ophiocordyceps australis TaxID=1399860 RepID=A0A2C5Y763_9HYPO|nr:hypothetical protein CDD81_4326 [Ophiocordyceps australis]
MASPPASPDEDFPCTLALSIPFLTPRIATIALETLEADPERSPLVRRQLCLDTSPDISFLQVNYQATTNRMLRVAVNSFMDNLQLFIQVIQQLDVDVINKEPKQSCLGPEQQQTSSREQES